MVVFGHQMEQLVVMKVQDGLEMIMYMLCLSIMQNKK